MSPLSEFFRYQWEGTSFDLEEDNAACCTSYHSPQMTQPPAPLAPAPPCRWESSPKRTNVNAPRRRLATHTTSAPRLPTRNIPVAPALKRSRSVEVPPSSSCAPRVPQRTSSLPKTSRDIVTTNLSHNGQEPLCQLPAARMA